MIPGDRERDSYCELLERMHELCDRRGMSFMDEMGTMARIWIAAAARTDQGTVSEMIVREGIAPGSVELEQLKPTHPQHNSCDPTPIRYRQPREQITKAYIMGANAARHGQGIDTNPYTTSHRWKAVWERGYHSVKYNQEAHG